MGLLAREISHPKWDALVSKIELEAGILSPRTGVVENDLHGCISPLFRCFSSHLMRLSPL